MLHEHKAERANTELQALKQGAAVERHRSVLMVRVAEDARNLIKQKLATKQQVRSHTQRQSLCHETRVAWTDI